MKFRRIALDWTSEQEEERRNIVEKSGRRLYLERRGELREDEPTPSPSSEEEIVVPWQLKPAMRKTRMKKINKTKVGLLQCDNHWVELG